MINAAAAVAGRRRAAVAGGVSDDDGGVLHAVHLMMCPSLHHVGRVPCHQGKCQFTQLKRGRVGLRAIV